MTEFFSLILALMGGAVLGLVFFGGLWLTVSKGIGARYPALWFLGSLLLRTAIVIAGFFYVTGGEFPRLLACLLGFVVVRIVITHRVKNHPEPLKEEDSHA